VPVKVKICGVRTPAIVEVAAEAGADYVGLVIFPLSPRHVEPENAQAITDAAAGRIETVAVLVDPDDALIDLVLEKIRPAMLQLHGRETPERAAEIRAHSRLPVIKAIGVARADDVASAVLYAGSADLILFDAKAPPAAAALPGGHGVAFDWQALCGLSAGGGFALSGGLNPGNVARALALTGASMVDVSSGVERTPGHKDAGLVRRFIQAAKGRPAQAEAKAS
jgi:phosphoribosylanthranilate isomerase